LKQSASSDCIIIVGHYARCEAAHGYFPIGDKPPTTSFLYAFSVLPAYAMTNAHQIEWRGLLENPAAIHSVFGEIDPDLTEVRLVGTNIAEGGSLLTLTLAVKRVPVSRPARWKAANAVSIELQCLGLEQASISMRCGNSTVSCEITKQGPVERMIRIIGPSADVVIRCGFLRVNRLVPYTVDYSQEAI
jgi:hypothetical protein